MTKDKHTQSCDARKRWDEHAGRYDEWYKTFEGAVENHVDWQLLKEHLPKTKNARILDAAGGTGRVTLPLAKLGFSVVLGDISFGMLGVALHKLRREGILDRVEIVQCDVRKLCFADETFDFVLYWDGGIETAKELVRVTKRGGKLSLFLMNRYRAAISTFHGHPDSALDVLSSKSHYVSHGREKHKVVGAQEARNWLEAEGLKIIDVYAVCGWLDVLRIPEEIRNSHIWDKKYFDEVTEMVLRLGRESAVVGMSRHLVVYGEKR